MTGILTLGATATAAVGAILVLVLSVRHALVARRERSVRRAEERLRPVALALAGGHSRAFPILDGREAAAVAGLVVRLARSVQGRFRERLAEFFETYGFIDEQLARLRSRRAWRRATAAYAVGAMGSLRVVPALIEALGDARREVRTAAALGLGRLGQAEAVVPLAAALAAGTIPRAAAAEALRGIGPPALPPLRDLAAHPEPRVQTLCLDLIGFMGDAADGATAAARLQDGSAEVRAAAARALGRLGAAAGTRELRVALTDRAPFVRTAAATALGRVGDRSAVPSLLALARADEFWPAQAAARAVARIDPRALPAAADAGRHLREAADLAAL